MLNHPKCHFLLSFLLFSLYSWNKATCSLGKGRDIWQQPKPDPTLKGQSFLHDTFPLGFLWGSGTSAFQTEGAWNQNGKGASIWDSFTHSSVSGSLDREVANVASDSYNRWEEDVKALEYLGVRSYSFSLSWPRLFPDGNARGQPNTAAVKHYSYLIERLLEKKIEPIVTLHHWDLPQVLQEDYGGWKNETMVELFEEYATFCFHTFGSRVRYWLTMHNPYLVAVQGYRTGVHAPGEKGGPATSLTVAHNLIKVSYTWGPSRFCQIFHEYVIFTLRVPHLFWLQRQRYEEYLQLHTYTNCVNFELSQLYHFTIDSESLYCSSDFRSEDSEARKP